MSRGILVFLVVVLLIVAILGINSMRGSLVQENFEADPQYQFKDDCTIYYTDNKNMQTACDEGEFEHPPLYYDIKIAQDPNNAEKWRNIKAEQAKPSMPSNGSRKVCKVTLPEWQQYHEGGSESMPPSIVMRPQDSVQGDVNNWAHCVYKVANQDARKKVNQFNTNYVGTAMKLDKEADDKTVKELPMNGASYAKMVLNRIGLPDISNIYCKWRGRKLDDRGNPTQSVPFQNGMILTMGFSNTKEEGLEVKTVEYMKDGNIITWDSALNKADILNIVKNLYTDNIINKDRNGNELLYKNPIPTRYNIVRVTKDICGTYEQIPVGNIGLSLKVPILVKTVHRVEPNWPTLGTSNQLTNNTNTLIESRRWINNIIDDLTKTLASINAEITGLYNTLSKGNRDIASLNTQIIKVTADIFGLKGVTIYQHCNYGGWAVKLPIGNYTMTQLRNLGVINDDASSIKVDAGITAILYQDDGFLGTQLKTNSDVGCFVDNGFNDALSSVRVINTSSDIPLKFNVSRGFATGGADNCGGALVCLDRYPIDCGRDAINQFRFTRPSESQGQYVGQCASTRTLGAPTDRATSWQENGGDWRRDTSIYLDRQTVDCGTNGVLTAFALQDSWNSPVPQAANTARYQYKCAKSTTPLACRNLSTPYNDEGGGNTIYLDRHDVRCNADEALSKFHLQRNGRGQFRYDYTCCKHS